MAKFKKSIEDINESAGFPDMNISLKAGFPYFEENGRSPKVKRNNN